MLFGPSDSVTLVYLTICRLRASLNKSDAWLNSVRQLVRVSPRDAVAAAHNGAFGTCSTLRFKASLSRPPRPNITSQSYNYNVRRWARRYHAEAPNYAFSPVMYLLLFTKKSLQRKSMSFAAADSKKQHQELFSRKIKRMLELCYAKS